MQGMYGTPPVKITERSLTGQFVEFMHYLYLPVRIPGSDKGLHPDLFQWYVPRRLLFLEDLVARSLSDAMNNYPHLTDPYVYVSAVRGMATPGNSLNRPGWHCDDFGGTDLNYIWADRFTTRYVTWEDDTDPQDHPDFRISADDRRSIKDFEFWAQMAQWREHTKLHECEPDTLYRLDPHVIHAVPEIPAPGGMRGFFKVSISTHRFNLLGNSVNYDLRYDWPMLDRQEVRNQPSGDVNRDYG